MFTKSAVPKIETSEATVLRLSDDIGKMSQRIGEMADRIGLMGDRIGVMADRVLETERIQSENLARTQDRTLDLIAAVAELTKANRELIAELAAERRRGAIEFQSRSSFTGHDPLVATH